VATNPGDDAERDTILDAALWCFTSIGEGATTIEAIAERSGLPQATVMRYFADVAAVRRGLYDLWAERMSAWAASV
jgi:AcrR family transcriptional regulator